MKCETCIWYRNRELTELEKAFIKANPNIVLDRRVCALGWCKGELYEERKENKHL